jgi:hypothetical protein
VPGLPRTLAWMASTGCDTDASSFRERTPRRSASCGSVRNGSASCLSCGASLP